MSVLRSPILLRMPFLQKLSLLNPLAPLLKMIVVLILDKRQKCPRVALFRRAIRGGEGSHAPQTERVNSGIKDVGAALEIPSAAGP